MADYVKHELPPEIEAQRPKGLTIQEEIQWDQTEINRLEAEGYYDKLDFDANIEEDDDPDDGSDNSVAENVSEINTGSDDDSNNSIDDIDKEAVEDTDVIEPSEPSLFANKPVSQPKKSKSSTRKKSSKDNANMEYLRVYTSAMDAMRRTLPYSCTKADLILAFTYIFTNGGCDLTDGAKEVVEKYHGDDSMQKISNQLESIDKRLRKQDALLQSIELCTCYNTFDRRYGSKEHRVSPKDTEFREEDNLAMLARLRKQAQDQAHDDELARGRAIYHKTKGNHN